MLNTIFCNSFMNEADGEAPSKIHCRGEARNPGFEVLLQQTHVNRCLFVLKHHIIYSQIATALSIPCVPSVKPLSPLFFLAKQATPGDESLRRSTASTRRKASPAGKTGGSPVGEFDLEVGGSGGSGSVNQYFYLFIFIFYFICELKL